MELSGDGGGGLVDAWATRDRNGRLAIAIWNGTIDQSKANGDKLLDRNVRLEVAGLEPGPVHIRHRRIDAEHSNIARHWTGGDWPDEAGWTRLHALDRLDELEPSRTRDVSATGRLDVEFDLPMPAVSLLEILPV